MHFSPDEFFHMHTVLISMSTKQSFFPSSPIKNFGCLVKMTLEGPVKWDEEKQDSCFIQFWAVRTAALAEGAVLSHSCTSAHLHSIYRWERAGQREQWGNSNFAWHTNPSQMVMLKITRNSNVELHRENRWFKAIHAPFQRDIQMWQNCHSENIFDRSTFCSFGERVSPVTVSNVNTIHTKPTRLSVSCGPLWNWPYFYVLCPQGATNNNTIKLNKYNPNDSQGQ